MKKIILLFVFMLSIISCDPVTYVTYNISNLTDKNLLLFFHSSNAIENDTLSLNKSTIKKWRIVSVSDRYPEKIDLNQYYDSIIVKSNDLVVRKYISAMIGKNIYNYEYWIENKKGKRDYEYTFEITKEDIADGKGK